MRILLWHGYLLEGTGSNIYTRALAREWSLAGHDVVVLCQERHPERFDLAGAEVVRPEIGGILPVFVVDRYEGLEPLKLQELTRAELDRYVALNAAAVRELLPADLVFANHVLPGGAVGRFVYGRNYALALVAQDRQHRLLVTALEGVHERLRGLFDRVEAALRSRTGRGRRRPSGPEARHHEDTADEAPPETRRALRCKFKHDR